MSLTAYELRADYAPDGSTPYVGGVIALLDGDLNLGQALEQNSGRIVVDSRDSELVTVLDAYPALKRAAAGDDRATLRRYDFMRGDSLRAEASRRGLTSGSLDDLRTGPPPRGPPPRAPPPPRDEVPKSPDPATPDDPMNRPTRRSRGQEK
jgi:hypothetical protein